MGGGQNFAFCTPANQHMSSTFFLFLIFNLQRLPELQKKELDNKNTPFVEMSTFIPHLPHVPATIDYMFVYTLSPSEPIELKIGMFMFSRSLNTSVMLVCSTGVIGYPFVVRGKFIGCGGFSCWGLRTKSGTR
jgi:hypothetical protein